jgi:hypothetical protein
MVTDTLNAFIVRGKDETSSLQITAGKLGNVNIAGLLTNSTFDIATSAGSLTLGQSSGNTFEIAGALTGFAVKANATDTRLTIGASAGRISSVQWINGFINAASIGALVITGQTANATTPAIAGNFSGDITLSGNSLRPGQPSLGSAFIAGALQFSAWSITGASGPISAGSIDHADLQLTGNLASLVVRGTINHLVIHAGDIGSMSATTWDTGSITATKLNALAITGKAATKTASAISGDAANLNISLSNPNANQRLITSVSIAGSLNNSHWDISGNAGSFRIGSIVNSQIYVGIIDLTSPTELPSKLSQFQVLDPARNSRSVLEALVITGNGLPATAPSFINSVVAAGTLANVSLKLVSIDPANPMHGFAASTRIGLYTRATGSPQPNQAVRVANKTAPGLYDSAGATPTSGFVLKIVPATTTGTDA